jgi:hypothetical protein
MVGVVGQRRLQQLLRTTGTAPHRRFARRLQRQLWVEGAQKHSLYGTTNGYLS